MPTFDNALISHDLPIMQSSYQYNNAFKYQNPKIQIHRNRNTNTKKQKYKYKLYNMNSYGNSSSGEVEVTFRYSLPPFAHKQSAPTSHLKKIFTEYKKFRIFLLSLLGRFEYLIGSVFPKCQNYGISKPKAMDQTTIWLKKNYQTLPHVTNRCTQGCFFYGMGS